MPFFKSGIWSANPTPEAIAAKREYARAYYLANKEKIKARAGEYYEKNTERAKELSRANWYRKNTTRRKPKVSEAKRIALRKAAALRWYYKNRPARTKEQIARENERARLYYHRKKAEAAYAASRLCRGRMQSVLRLRGAVKSLRSHALLGCTPMFLRKYIEAQFLPGMTWENYGTWHIDHIRPCASFDLLLLSEQKACFHYSNLQPLWALDNLKKGAKYGEASES